MPRFLMESSIFDGNPIFLIKRGLPDQILVAAPHLSDDPCDTMFTSDPRDPQCHPLMVGFHDFSVLIPSGGIKAYFRIFGVVFDVSSGLHCAAAAMLSSSERV